MSDRLIDRLKAAYRSHKVKVLDVDVHVTPLTLAEQAKASAAFPDDTARRQAQILIDKVLDAEGKPLFTVDDRDALAGEIDAGAFTAVWAALNGRSVDEQAEK